MSPDLVDVVLVRPARPANVAAACRAMKNMGLRSLRIVDPPDGLGDAAARSLAYGAWDVLDSAAAAGSLREAVAGCVFVAGTSGRPLHGAWTPRRFALEGASRAGAGRVAVVFGPEASGLTTAELGLCHETVHIPAHAAQPSLNLAQAILVVSYEIFVSGREAPAAEPPARASAGELEDALAALQEGLLGIGYLDRNNPGPILAEIRRLLARAGPTPRELNLLRGMARQLLWAAGRIARDREPGA
jgi:TrmH family RNA methyltransferase